ncbi:reverse transcriptase domain-containing protein [Fimbriiglobus ruber]|uniref:Retron-type RNA-directed DNA polymerase n=1 Tax=Fimbriiglobus ruber TaxID=1908690 RepID=A0A225DU81_9BACT|nr:reverse transcriptase domain-containing protein [Fimbriiglobus ruber]OWK41136.1 Retron-type RNA-directed DNA polymerase [Fimbriiglobus ruber]
MTTKLALLPTRTDTPGRTAPALADVQRMVFQATRGQPRPLAGLMPWVLDRRNLAAAWDRVSAADGADTPGPDGLTCGQLKHRVGPWLADLADALFHRAYHPAAARWVDVPKAGDPGRTRRIGILNVRDRVVQTAVKQVVEPVLEPVFLPGSFGFRPGRSVAGTLDAAVRGLSGRDGQPRLLWAVPLDVADCFPTIDHEWVRRSLADHVADPDLLDLLRRVFDASGETVGRLWWQRRCGVVQGSALSPLLCNLTLHALDVAAAQMSCDTQGGAAVLRYADDLLVLARDAAAASRTVAALRAALHLRQQRFRREPDPVPAAGGVEWLGVVLRPRALSRPDDVEFGYEVPRAKIRSMIARLVEMTAPPSDKIDAAAFNLAKWIVSVSGQLRDWRQAYLYADNAPDLFRVLDDVARDRIGELIKAVSGSSWAEVRRSHFARLPRGFWTWEVPGARLTVLSSLAPHTPARLTRRPVWWSHAPDATQPAGGGD